MTGKSVTWLPENIFELISRDDRKAWPGLSPLACPPPHQNVEEEQHLPLPVFWRGSFHGLWTSRVQALVFGFVTV